MADSPSKISGGCLCGAVRYEAEGDPIYAGYCYCRDCQRLSGSAFVAFIGFPAERVTFKGRTRVLARPSFMGESHRNFCLACGSLVFGGIVGTHDQHTVYAGTLDDTSAFQPTMAIFNRSRPAWSPLPEGITVFETMPGAPEPE